MIKIDTKKLEELKTCSDFATNREAEHSLLSLLEAKKQQRKFIGKSSYITVRVLPKCGHNSTTL